MGESMTAYTERVRAEVESGELLPSAAEQSDRRVLADRTEQEIVEALRANAADATTQQTAAVALVAERIAAGDISDQNLPNALRALNDTQTKAVDNLLKLTGRAPTAPESDVSQLLRGLARDGLVKMNVQLEVGADRDEAA